MPSLRVQDQDLFYTWHAAGDPVLLFIHGLGSSNSFYAPIIPSLVQQGISCLAFDTPGSALSPYRGQDSDPAMLCGAASALLTALKIDARRVVAVGHSMGAIVASELARSLDVAGAVLVGPVNPNEALVGVFEARVKLVDAEGMEGVAAVVPFAATGPRATPTQQAFIRTLLLAQSPEGYKSLCRTIQRATRPRYEDIKCPLLIIAGSHDKTSPMGGSEHILQSWGVDAGRKRLEVLQGVGHWHCIEAADGVLALVSGFVAEVTPTS
ncbi:hypothetical protein JDV02_003916 [Purpureocillium takamizusanense]|uniref:AB hydrolase-1 domain-containing protein n=1 Tax=Purpureocillium takamizusanense TaxID=2060973 RepID=A0A9Q8VA74_9HYPO|nr:uncharacterized protein JDV02_003916 [Purpureocillium takamizusanense]UNI17584.1 hypothetical protein JDV02_003916 [Purpureocillium takamizusanense]